MATVFSEEVKVEVFQRETIKPSSPTPHHLQTLELSILDKCAPAVHMSTVLFYAIDQNVHDAERYSSSQHLKRSLSQTLTHFYPLAGRVRNNLYIECNDEGAEFFEARINCSMSKVLDNPDVEMLRKLVPTYHRIEGGGRGEGEATGRMLLVQSTVFECSGTAIGLSISHKFFDASSYVTFLKCWAATALGSSNAVLPEFGAAALLSIPQALNPFSNASSEPPLVRLIEGQLKCRTKRFVVDAENIAALKSKAASKTVKNPTRVEAVSALIWRCAIQAALSKSSSPPQKGSVFFQMVNGRTRTVPPLSQKLVGNLSGFAPAILSAKEYESQIELPYLTHKLRKGMEQVKEKYSKLGLNGDGIVKEMNWCTEVVKNGQEADNYFCSSRCKLFVSGDADLGFGKPVWESMVVDRVGENENAIYMMETRDGDGIEAWLTLEEDKMELFEHNQELLAFASLNPSVI